MSTTQTQIAIGALVADRLKEATEIIRDVEWIDCECPSCFGLSWRGGHDPNCRLKAFLEKAD